MAVANFRFYEELNDFLAPGRGKRDTTFACAPGAAVKHAIEAHGVPHTEVELILANGESVDLGVQLDDVTVCKRMVLADMLSFEAGVAPYARKLE
jgi:hypothetical protein